MSSNKRSVSQCFRNEFQGTDAYTRHKKLIADYVQHYGLKPPAKTSSYKTERDILHENHKFVREDTDNGSTWEQRIAKKYYDALFKEYAICELKQYKEGRIALRWRIEKEVVLGKGQFICASTRCDSTEGLKSWEVNFGYIEDGEKKNELVKVRLCPDCSDKLNYKTKMKLAKSLKTQEKEREMKRRKRSGKSTSHTEESSSSRGSSSDSSDHEEEEKDEPKTEQSVWSQPLEKKEEKSKEEEYEDYFSDLLQ